jgi:hypothetical protein
MLGVEIQKFKRLLIVNTNDVKFHSVIEESTKCVPNHDTDIS